MQVRCVDRCLLERELRGCCCVCNKFARHAAADMCTRQVEGLLTGVPFVCGCVFVRILYVWLSPPWVPDTSSHRVLRARRPDTLILRAAAAAAVHRLQGSVTLPRWQRQQRTRPLLGGHQRSARAAHSRQRPQLRAHRDRHQRQEVWLQRVNAAATAGRAAGGGGGGASNVCLCLYALMFGHEQLGHQQHDCIGLTGSCTVSLQGKRSGNRASSSGQYRGFDCLHQKQTAFIKSGVLAAPALWPVGHCATRVSYALSCWPAASSLCFHHMCCLALLRSLHVAL
jgi:hypothetical protein